MPEHLESVLVLSMIFPPDGVSSAQLLGDICEDLHNSGVHVQVVTTQPHYNTDEMASRAQPIRWNRLGLTGTSQYRGVDVTHVRMNAKSPTRMGRLAQWGWFHLASLAIGMRRRKKFDGVLCISPPPTVSLVGSVVSRLAHARMVFCVWELYPEILIPLGKLKRGSLGHRLLLRLEELTYEHADVVAPLNDAMKASITARYPDLAERVEVIPTFADTELLRPLPRENSLRSDLGLENSFVVGYAGNLAVTQSISTMLDAADRAECDPRITFLVSGGGSMESEVCERANDAPHGNIVFTGHLPYAVVPDLYAATDVCVISLDVGISDSALPSKLYRIMASGRPIVAIASPRSPLADFVRERNVGLVVDPGDDAAFLAAVERLRRDPKERKRMGEVGRSVAVDEFSRPVVSRKYREALRGAGV